MKLIIDIPELDYECAKQRWMRGDDAHKTDYYISKGVPLDDVKAEIEEKSFGIFDSPNLIKTIDVFEILDNIDKAESEDI